MCNSLNWWVFGEREDPGNEIAWLEQTLLDIEADNGIALIMGHYTPSSCQHQFGTRYHALMERFQHIVRFGMQGHTHKESYEITRSISDPSKNIGVNNIAGSATTYMERNPSFMVIEFDAETMVPLNMQTYYMNVTQANLDGKPTWELLHDQLKEYEMTDMSPNSYFDLSQRFLTDMDLATQFVWNKDRRVSSKPDSTNQKGL